MTYRVVTGGGGLAGWALLKKTRQHQINIIASEGSVKAAAEKYSRGVSSIHSAQELVANYRIIDVSLRAFGLESEVKNKAFITKVLTSDLSDKNSLANKLSNKAYLKLARNFGFGPGAAPQTAKAGFPAKIVAKYIEREFERRVGESDQNLRLSLNAQRELSALASRSSSNATKWYEVLGNPPLRKVFEGAFGFSSAYGKLPIDRQMRDFALAAQRMFGTGDLSVIGREEHAERLIRNFLARQSISQGVNENRYSTALKLLAGVE